MRCPHVVPESGDELDGIEELVRKHTGGSSTKICIAER